MNYREHIDELAAELDVTVHYSDWRAVASGTSTFGPGPGGSWNIHLTDDVDDVSGYTIALHELGHAATLPRPIPRQHDCSDDYVLEYETKAWEWARDNGALGFDPYCAAIGLSTYLLGHRDAEAGWEYAMRFMGSLDIDSETFSHRFQERMRDLALAA